MYHHRAYAQTTPDKPAYIMGKSGEVVTFAQLEERANRCSQYFRAMGLEPRDRIAIMLENSPRFLEIMFAATVAGLVTTTISTHLTVSEIEYIINDCEAKIFFASPYRKEIAEELRKSVPDVRQFLSVGGPLHGYRSYEETVAGYPATPIPECIEGKEMLYSSGTTGRPKGIVGDPLQDMPFGILHPAVITVTDLYKINADTIYLSPAPLYHTAPLRWSMWTIRRGGTVVIMEHFDAEDALALIEKYKVTTSQWVPTMFIRMLKLPEETRKKYNFSSMKIAIHASAPCPPQVKEQMIAWWGPVIYEFYSATEGATFLHVTSEEWLQHKGTVGRSVIGTLHIIDENENELPIGETGSIFVENGVPFEYHGDPEKTKKSYSHQGWSTFGDIGYLDAEGYLYLTDRKADMIISGGVNIYPKEAEDILVTHPKVTDVAVFGIPNEDFGEEVKAVVQPVSMDEAGSALEKELLEYCWKNLAKMKCPRTIDFEKELPRHPSGKLFKRTLKDKYWKK